MSVQESYFEHEDLFDELPPPGRYPCSIRSARFRTSANGNRMLQVVHDLEDLPGRPHSVTDYFVLAGEAVSAAGLAFARRRLVHLYRACGLHPQEGEQITPAALVGARLRVWVEHERWGWQNQWRLRVVAYQRLGDDEEVPI